MGSNQNDNNIKYAILTQDVLSDKTLSSTDKIVLARISGFKEFFESASKTAEFCGLSERTVKSAKQRLLKAGYLVELGNNGRGKTYAADVQKLHIRSAEVAHQKCKNGQSDVQKTAPYNKDKIKNKRKGENEEFGKPEINAFLEKWKKATGNDVSSIKRERFATANLLKSQTEEGIEKILESVKTIHTTKDQYAPAITLPSDLVGQYSKLSKLRLWTAKNEKAKRTKTKGVDLSFYGKNEAPKFEQTETDRMEVIQQFKQLREKKPQWLKEKKE